MKTFDQWVFAANLVVEVMKDIYSNKEFRDSVFVELKRVWKEL